MDDLEHVENSNEAGIDNAELRLRSLERNQNTSTPEDSALPANAEPHTAVDMSQEWWSKKNEKPQQTLLERGKEAAVVGAAGIILVGGSLLLGHEALDNSGVAQSDRQDVSQTQVIDRPTSSQKQFVETNQPYTLNHDAVEATASAQVDSAQTADWWHSVPEYSQRDLTYNGANTQYGCVPSSTSMVLDYWHQKDASYSTMTAQELLDVNTVQGEFDKYGMSPTNMHDELDKLGYTAQDHTNSNLDELKGAVTDGPVIAVVKLGMKTEGTNHVVVVTGLSDRNEVRVNDPWTGKSQTYSWEQFSKSWGANFGKDSPKNIFTTIHPKSI